MSEFYELLLEQPEEEAKDIALSLELFVNGSLNIFNNHTNVNVQARFIVYGTRDLGKELGAISTLVMLEISVPGLQKTQRKEGQPGFI